MGVASIALLKELDSEGLEEHYQALSDQRSYGGHICARSEEMIEKLRRIT